MPFKPLETIENNGEVFRATPGEPNSEFKALAVVPKTKKEGKTILDKAADLTFGTTGKTVGSLFTSGIASAAGLYGQATGSKKALEFEKRLNETAQPEKNITASNIAFGFLEQYPGGGFVSKTLKKIPGGEKLAEALGKIPDKFRASAIKDYSQALGATKEEFKKTTQKVVPELLDRGIKARNLDLLSDRAANETSKAGKAIGEFEEALPETVKSKTKPVIEKLESLKSKYIVEGKNVNPSAVKAIEGIQETIKQFGEEVSTKSLIKVRRILDEGVDASRGFVKDKITNISDKAEKAAADSIREIISADLPDLAKLNAEFVFWNNVKRITKETLKRKTGQQAAFRQIVGSTVGAGSGFSSGESMGERLKNATIVALFGKYAATFSSPGYKMLSANTKNKLAKIIASGDQKKIVTAMTKISAAIKNLSDKPVDQETEN